MNSKKLQVFYTFTHGLAALSNCHRLQVGCVVVPLNLTEVLAIGYNGPPAGIPNDSCREGKGVCGCIHAEANALIKLQSRESSLVLITTTCPCEHCAGLIINSRRIEVVIYDDAFRDMSGLDRLLNTGIKVERMNDA